MEEDHFSCVRDGGLGKRVLQQGRNLGKRICFKHGLGMEEDHFSCVRDGGLGKRVLQQGRNLGKRICFKHGLGMEESASAVYRNGEELKCGVGETFQQDWERG